MSGIFDAFLDAHELLESAADKQRTHSLSATENQMLEPLSKTEFRTATGTDHYTFRRQNNTSATGHNGHYGHINMSTSSSTRGSVPQMGNSGRIERDDDMVGPLTRLERKAKVQKYLLKRARMKKNRLEGKGHHWTHTYAGRTKFANARRRVKGRFVTLEFMQSRQIKFDSIKPGWVCKTLGGKVFLTADEAVKAVDAANISYLEHSSSTSSSSIQSSSVITTKKVAEAAALPNRLGNQMEM